MKLLIMKIEFRIYYLVDELSRAALAWAIWKMDDLHRRNWKRERETRQPETLNTEKSNG